jgi:hypothetical protein
VHKFWDTQPVPRLGQQTEENDCIEPNKPSAELRQEPYNMPPGFEWSTLDVQSTDQLEEMYTLLNENYVEDDDNMFRFDYSIPFLQVGRCFTRGRAPRATWVVSHLNLRLSAPLCASVSACSGR